MNSACECWSALLLSTDSIVETAFHTRRAASTFWLAATFSPAFPVHSRYQFRDKYPIDGYYHVVNTVPSFICYAAGTLLERVISDQLPAIRRQEEGKSLTRTEKAAKSNHARTSEKFARKSNYSRTYVKTGGWGSEKVISDQLPAIRKQEDSRSLSRLLWLAARLPAAASAKEGH